MAFLEQAPGGEVALPSKTLITALSDGSTQDYWAKLCNLAYAIGIPEGRLLNGKIEPSVNGSGDLLLALKTLAGNDPSMDDPAYITVNGTIRKIAEATNITLAAGTNWFNLGAGEFATLEQDLFAYLVYDSADLRVRITCARIPHGKVVSDFDATATNEKHLAGYANFAATDDVVNIGRFAATLSAGSAYTWSVPTYNSANLVQDPIFTTRLLDWLPQWTNLSLGDGQQVAKYVLRISEVAYTIDVIFGSTSSISAGNVSHTLPFSKSAHHIGLFGHFAGTLRLVDAGVIAYVGNPQLDSTTSCGYRVVRVDGTYATQAGLSSTVPFTWAADDEIHEAVSYFI